ncbi:hypothetical protein UFOVP58_134 [uncultured Caudovirales phage]|uniref:Collagen triple helix repeat n=1 Tax=uncultured Caudovirales phage TaxID=2100421 RepID=A0A6J5KZP9_9CAUD|nr:hypothetical protein UFOVP58_134 [uncultured Caudovirales phage]
MKVSIKQGTPAVTSVLSDPSQVEVVSVNTQGPIGPQGPQGVPGANGSGITQIVQASDVITTGITDGAVLIYKSSSQHWEASTQLNTQIMDAGFF